MNERSAAKFSCCVVSNVAYKITNNNQGVDDEEVQEPERRQERCEDGHNGSFNNHEGEKQKVFIPLLRPKRERNMIQA